MLGNTMYYNNQAPVSGNRYKLLMRIGMLAAALGITGWVVYWLLGYSFIVINNPEGRTITVSINNQRDASPALKQTNAKEISLRVGRGRQEVTVLSEQGSYFAVLSGPGKWGKKTIDPTFKQEQARTFVGEKPNACYLYTTVLLSYPCNSDIASLATHVPATNTLPTYIKKEHTRSTPVTIHGTAPAPGGSIALVKARPDRLDDDVDTRDRYYSIYLFKSGSAVTENYLLSKLDNKRTFRLRPAASGYVIHDENFEQVYHLASYNVLPVQLARPGNLTGIRDMDLSGRVQAILAGPAKQDPKGKTTKSEIILSDGDKITQRREFNKDYRVAHYCGNNLLCVGDSKTVDVFNVAQGDLTLVTTVSGVADFRPTNQGLILVRKDAIVRFNPETQTGHREYSFGEYTFTSLSQTEKGYIVSLGGLHKQAAVYIEQNVPAAAFIDKALLELKKMPEVKDISPYGKIIFVTPSVGDMVYRNDIQSFSYDPKVVREVTAKVFSRATELGISPNYTVVSTIRE